jgi:lipopolysaccharide cholinephosphotransferase
VREIQDKLLEILLYFQTFCQENGLRFVLAGGTCLGAVRHQGFIPWDDDVDVFMLRDDYEKLQELWETKADTSRYACVRSNEKYNIHHTATEIKDNQTTFINKHSADLDINQGLMIDVIPLDAVAPSKFGKMHQMIHSMLYCCFNFQRLPEHKGKLTYQCTKLALSLVRSAKMRYRFWKHSERQIAKYPVTDKVQVASFGEGATIMRQRFPVEWFLKPKMLHFEGHQMPVPSDYDTYLRISYGDYMQLPPESERVCRHDTVFMDLHHGYQQYKGVYYCVNENQE